GAPADLFAWSNVLANLRKYGSWFADTQTPLAFAGFLALLVPIRSVWPQARNRRLVIVLGLFVATIWAEYFAYEVFDAWWYLRFLLPSWPLVMTGFAAVLWLPARRAGWPLKMAVAAAVLAIGVHGLVIARERFAFDIQRGEKKYPSVAK